MNNWETDLRNLPDPVEPPSTTATVMRSVRAIEASRADTAPGARPGAARHAVTDLRAWAIAIGMATGLAAYLAALLDDALLPALLSPQLAPQLVGWGASSAIPLDSGPVALLAGAGLAVYLMGVLLRFGEQTED